MNEHVYVNGERKTATNTGGYIHVGPNGKTLGPNLDIELALQFGYTAGLTFVSLNNGDVAVIGTDPDATLAACEGDAVFKAAGDAMVAEVMAKARAENPMARLLDELMKGMAGDSQLRAPQPRRSSGFADFMASLGEEDDCDCEECRARRARNED